MRRLLIALFALLPLSLATPSHAQGAPPARQAAVAQKSFVVESLASDFTRLEEKLKKDGAKFVGQ